MTSRSPGWKAVPPDVETQALTTAKGPSRCTIACGFVIAISAALQAYDSYVHSPNWLEKNLLPAGFLHCKYGRFDIAQVNTPLSRMLAAVPLVLFFNVNEDWGSLDSAPGLRPEYPVGRDFVNNNHFQIRPIYFCSRCIGLVFSVAGAASVYGISRTLYGGRGALVSTLVWCFHPLVMAHSPTVGHDAPGAALAAVAFLYCLNLTTESGLGRLTLCGVTMGAALLTRITVAPLLLAWALFRLCSGGTPLNSRSFGRIVGSAAYIGGLILFIINLGYEFNGTLTPIGQYRFVSDTFKGTSDSSPIGNRFGSTRLQGVPLPVPADLVNGIDLQQKDFESPRFQSYLLGEWRESGWWYYYCVAWCITTPIGFQLLLGISMICFLRDLLRFRGPEGECLLVASIAIVFVLASVKCGFTIHYRYVLPAFPFIAVVSGRPWQSVTHGSFASIVRCVLVAAGVASSMMCYPHSMSYFNEVVGGPRHGGEYLLYSSCDWGQDIYFLTDWYEAQEDTDAIYLHCTGALSPQLLGLPSNQIPRRRSPDFRKHPDEEGILPGRYVISVSSLYSPDGEYRYLDTLNPIEHIGYSIKVYDVKAKDIAERQWNKLVDRSDGKSVVNVPPNRPFVDDDTPLDAGVLDGR